MKKIFVALMACVALCNVASAITPTEAYLVVHSGLDELRYDNRKLEYVKNLPYETFRQYTFAVVDKALAITNKMDGHACRKILGDVNFGSIPGRNGCRSFVWVCGERLNEKDLDVVDTKFAALFTGKRLMWDGDVPRFFDEYPYFPKTCEVLFKEYDVDKLLVNMYRLTPKHAEEPSPAYLAAQINLLVGQQRDNFGELKNTLRAFVLKTARMRLRERSQGFVVRRDGSNPLQEVFDRAAACINAPHQQGLKEFVEEYAPGYKWIDVDYPSDMDVMVLVGDILNGKQSINQYRGVLFFCLGATQYNEFIDRYNGRH